VGPSRCRVHVRLTWISADELIQWGDWGWACQMAFAYRDPRRGELVTVEQTVRVARPKDWTPRWGPATIVSGASSQADCCDIRAGRRVASSGD
jgi:hypothetical protein